MQEGTKMLIDYRDPRPIYEQIVDYFQSMILKGILKPDEQLPSVRSLAMELSTNPNTVQKAYQELERNGLLYSVKGKGSFVSESQEQKNRRLQELTEALIRIIREAKALGMAREVLWTNMEEAYDRAE